MSAVQTGQPDGPSQATTVAAALRLQLLHTPRLIVAGSAVHTLERKDAALLAMVAVEGSVPRAKAAALLWPDADDERARNNLRQRIFRLRRLAARDLVCAGSSLSLAAAVEHDLDALGPRLSDDPDAAAGELLGDIDYGDCTELHDWVQVAREQWRTARRNALAEIAAELEALGRIAPALAYAQRLAADDPTLEHAHRRVMRLHYLRGDRAAALAAYERCRDALGKTVGAQPGKETLELARLIEASGVLPQAPVTAAKPVTVLRPPRLVGRAREWQALEHARDHLRAALVSGEPGVGKTRLLTDFAAANGNALVAGSRPGDARVPYSVLAALLRALLRCHGAPGDDWVNAELAHLVPEIGQPSGKFEALRLQMAVVRAIEQWHDAGLRVLVVDDLHFADDATLEMLPALAIATDARVVWLLGVRANETPAALGNWVAQQDDGALAQLRLGALDEAAVLEFVESLTLPGVDSRALAPALARHTGGNPLFMLETLNALLALGEGALRGAARLPAPASVGELIERRLQQLSPKALKLARVAAIAGQDFSAELAAQVLHEHPLDLAEAWRELEAAHIIRDSAFAHDLILEATLRSVPKPIAQVLHGEVATLLENRNAPAARVAQHWFDSAEWRKAGENFRAAAAIAQATSQRVEEARVLERAIECFERAGDQAAAFDALHELAESHLVFSNVTAARAVSVRLMQEARTDAQRLLALNAHADALNVSREHEAAAAAAEQMLALARRVGEERAAFNASRKLAGALSTVGRHEAALDVHNAQRDWAQSHENDRDVRVYLCDRGYLLEQAARPAEAVDAYRHAIQVAFKEGDLAIARGSLTNLAVTLWRLGRLAEALEHSDHAQRLSLDMGGASSSDAVDLAQRGAILRDLGRYREALEQIEHARGLIERSGSLFWRMAAEDHLALTFIALGQPGRAQRLLATLPDQAPPFAQAHRHICRSQLARATGASGRNAAAAARHCASAGVPWRIHLLAEFEFAASCDPVEGADRCRQIAADASRRGAGGLALHATARAADCELRAGRIAGACELARQVLQALRGASPFGLMRTELLWIAHQALHAAGDPDAPTPLQLGAKWTREIAERHVPDEFRASFLDRNPFQRALLTTASRRRG